MLATPGSPRSPGPPPTAPNPPVAAARSAILRFLRDHPIVCLALLTPGVVEYLSTSSSLLLLVESPALFFVFLLVNVAQYTSGAVLVREAMLRWGKGWATVALLGMAYGITEEGLGDNTLFRNTQHADGVLGWYGHFLGVNWVWSAGVLSLHVIVSISLPILLLGLALPATRGRALVGPRGIGLALVGIVGSTTFESLTVLGLYHFWMGVPLFVGCLGAIGGLVLAAYRAPPGLWSPTTPGPTTGPAPAFAAGFLFFPAALFVEYGSAAFGVPPTLAIGVELAVFVGLLEWIRRRVGRLRGEYVRVNLAFGFVLWEGVFGVLVTIGLPYTLPLLALAILFFVRLRRRYAPGSEPLPMPPAGALGRGDVSRG